MPLLLYVATSGAFLFGYAKPVPVNFGRLRNPKRDMVWVALAGPGVNFLMALGWTVAAYVMVALGVEERFFLDMAQGGVLVNLVTVSYTHLDVYKRQVVACQAGLSMSMWVWRTPNVPARYWPTACTP